MISKISILDVYKEERKEKERKKLTLSLKKLIVQLYTSFIHINIKKISSSILWKKKVLRYATRDTERRNATSVKISLKNGIKYIARIIFTL